MFWKSIYFPEKEYYPEPKAAHSCDRIEDKLYIFGGWNGRTALDTLECYDLSLHEWRILLPSGECPTGRNNHASCVMNDLLYIHGGHDGDKWLDDFYELDSKKSNWRKISFHEYQYSPQARACHTLSRINRKIYMYGGYDGTKSFKDIEMFNIETQLWTTISIKPPSEIPSARNAHSATVINKKIFIYGGHYQNIHLNDLIIFDPEKSQWEFPQISGTVPSGLRGHSCNFILNKLYIFGGYDGNNRSSDIYRLTLDDYVFTKINTSKEVISVRQRHSANLIDNYKILFFGGFEGTKWLNNFDILDIARLEESLFLQKSQINLRNDFKMMINNPRYSDVVFLFGERKIYSHKGILSCRVIYFRNMFSDHMIEKSSDMIPISLFEYDTFLGFLEFVYTSNISKKEFKELLSIYQLADVYTYDILKNYCEELLQFLVSAGNVITCLVLAHKHNSEGLENICLDYIVKHKREISRCENVTSLVEYPTLMMKILMKLDK